MVKAKRKLKICLVASAGGHLTELLRVSSCWKEHDPFYITTTLVVQEKLQTAGKVYVTGECNRNHPFKVIRVLLKCIRVVFKEKPDVVISTGAAVGCITCFLGKLIGARIVWMDSITNVEKLSLSGRMVRYIADLFVVQWPELSGCYNNVEYLGAVI
jgi:UDP-N-acetylglucosamine:LPS N-acetylglucosamine transferase